MIQYDQKMGQPGVIPHKQTFLEGLLHTGYATRCGRISKISRTRDSYFPENVYGPFREKKQIHLEMKPNIRMDGLCMSRRTSSVVIRENQLK